MVRLRSKRAGILLGVLLLAGCASPGLRKVSLKVSSLYYPDRYIEIEDVRPFQRFPILDLPIEGMVSQFVADFAIDTTAMRAFSRSDTLHNPAVRVRIFEGDSLIDSTWAFPVDTFKHASRTRALVFEVIRFEVGKPYVLPSRAADTSGDGSGK